MGGGGGCCVGNFSCCVGDFSCCIAKAIKDFFCNDSCCVGNAPGPSESEIHAKMVADELAEMKKKMDESARKQETDIMEYLGRSINTFLVEVRVLNKNSYGGKQLNINTDLIIKKNDELKNRAIGCIGNVVNKRLVQTDKELSVILEERDKEKRQKNFQSFVDKVRDQAVDEFIKEIDTVVNQQSEIVKKEIDTRLKEVNKSMQESVNAYTAILESKQKDSKKIEEMQTEYMYEISLCKLLLDEVES